MSYHGEQNGTHRAGALGPGLGALVGLVLGLDWASLVVWPAVIGVLQIRKRFDVKTTDWVDFLGFLGTFLFVIYDRHGGSIFSPEFQFLRAQNQSLRRGLRACK